MRKCSKVRKTRNLPRARSSHRPRVFVARQLAEDGAWGAYLPDLPGVVALGATRPEVEERTEEALAAYADDLRGRGGSLPAPHHAAGTVAA